MEGPKVITSAYDFIRWAIPHIAKFPRNQRYTLGERIEDKLIDLLGLLIEAQYSKEKIASSIQSWLGYAIHSDSFHLKRRILSEYNLGGISP